jgi:hypothetical protein
VGVNVAVIVEVPASPTVALLPESEILVESLDV